MNKICKFIIYARLKNLKTSIYISLLIYIFGKIDSKDKYKKVV